VIVAVRISMPKTTPTCEHVRHVTDGQPCIRSGNGTLPETDLVELLHQAGVAHVVSAQLPWQSAQPQHGRSSWSAGLPEAGIGYSWDRRLGGRRRPDPASAQCCTTPRGISGLPPTT